MNCKQRLLVLILTSISLSLYPLTLTLTLWRKHMYEVLTGWRKTRLQNGKIGEVIKEYSLMGKSGSPFQNPSIWSTQSAPWRWFLHYGLQKTSLSWKQYEIEIKILYRAITESRDRPFRIRKYVLHIAPPSGDIHHHDVKSVLQELILVKWNRTTVRDRDQFDGRPFKCVHAFSNFIGMIYTLIWLQNTKSKNGSY